MSITRKKKRTYVPGNRPFKHNKLREDMQGCLEILKTLQSKTDAHPFLQPVDWKRLDLPDYPLIVKRPMDLGTIEKRMLEGFYSTANDFAADVRLVWSNAQKYNRPESDIYKMAETLSKFFDKKFTKVTKSIVKNKKRTQKGHREVTRSDRLSFADNMGQLSSEILGQIVESIREQCPGAIMEESDAVEIEIDKIDSATLLDLNEYAINYIQRTSVSEPSYKKQKR
mmetsp:Transcript_317/g.838  ORF Transcript_317/g.838 Transcript_317/m.838 type:complete len:226 (+) Transcript_317:189-866(+)|eukprot:CAMPEP_0114510466 /NCGR_PEP_ID=MMETSP0109-20121206/13810_1 /TAXON_ID=29199 /ORGANISM="Chlorarachnion reptans, Strain CCCM449" /LENGTH=225 /DNA_ID=CAMNT_0001689791 /DNA_START=89 /DNA_END=766 /DNA_ORIENTATION=+